MSPGSTNALPAGSVKTRSKSFPDDVSTLKLIVGYSIRLGTLIRYDRRALRYSRSPGEPWGGSNFVRVSSVFVGRETGDGVGDAVAIGLADAVGVGVEVGVGDAVGVDVGDAVGVDVGAGVTLWLPAVGVGVGEISSCGDGVGVALGVADVVAFDGVGVGDLRTPAAFDFGFGVGVGLGIGVCALRSTPR